MPVKYPKSGSSVRILESIGEKIGNVYYTKVTAIYAEQNHNIGFQENRH
jgi:hypothetical protein